MPYCKNEPDNVDKYLLYDGDVVISRAGSVGVSYLIDNPKRSIFASYLIRFKPLIDKHFFAYFLNSPFYWQEISNKSVGIALANVNATKLKQIVISLPPLPEQHRIVSKLESIFGRIDACREKLEKLVQQTKSASGSLSQLKSSILKQAFEGKLVPQDPNDEPAEMLLRRLHDGSDNKLEFETEGLPDGWIKTLLTNIVTNDKYAIKRGPFGSHLRKEFFKESGFKVYEQQNAINNNFDIGNYYIDEKKFQQLKAFELKRGDLIISCSGTIGKIAIVPDNFQKGIINQALLKITINTNIFLIPFFIHFFNFWKMNEGIKSQGSGMQNLASVKVLKKIPILFPPLPEQRRIVSKLESIFERIDARLVSLKLKIMLELLTRIIPQMADS